MDGANGSPWNCDEHGCNRLDGANRCNRLDRTNGADRLDRLDGADRCNGADRQDGLDGLDRLDGANRSNRNDGTNGASLFRECTPNGGLLFVGGPKRTFRGICGDCV